MQRYEPELKEDFRGAWYAAMEEDEDGGYYLASDADAELSQAASAVEAKGVEIVGLKERVEVLEKALRRLTKAVELFDNEADGGLSKWDPAVTESKELLGPSS